MPQLFKIDQRKHRENNTHEDKADVMRQHQPTVAHRQPDPPPAVLIHRLINPRQTDRNEHQRKQFTQTAAPQNICNTVGIQDQQKHRQDSGISAAPADFITA